MKKKIITLVVFILTLFSFSSVFAVSTTDFLNSVKSKFSDFKLDTIPDFLLQRDNQYHFLLRYPKSSTSYYYYLFASETPLVVSSFSDNSITITNEIYSRVMKYEWQSFTDSLIAKGGSSNSDHNVTADNLEFVLSDFNIKKPDGSSFSYIKPDLESDSDSDFQVTLPAIIQETPLEEVLVEIVGLLPIILVCLAFWIGLRKALALLSNFLRQS